MRTNMVGRVMAGCLAMGLFFALSTAPSIAQTTRFVSSGGSDSGDCSSSGSPCQSIPYALGQAASGDEIQVGPGVYPQIVVNKSVTLTGVSDPVISVGPNQTGVSITANNVVFQGFRVTGPHTASYLIQDWNDSSTLQTFGIALQPGVTGALVQNNLIEHVRSGVQGLGSGGGTVINNTVDNTKGAILVRTGSFVVSGNQEGSQGNEWGIVVISSLAPNPAAASTLLPLQSDEGYDEAVLGLSDANGGMSVLDRRFSSGNTSHAHVAAGASPGPADDFGIGNGLGNPRQPWGAIQHGITSVVAGGLVTVAPGTYVENVSVNKNVKLLADRGTDGEGVVTVHGTSGSRFVVTAGGSAASPLRIEGFRLTGSGNGVNFQGSVSHVSLVGLTVGVGTSGINFTASGTYGSIDIEDSSFNGGTRGIFANNVTLNGFRLAGSEVKNASTHGIFLGNASTAPAPGNITDITLEDCHFESNGGSDNGNGDVSLYHFNGDAVLRNVTIQGHADATIAGGNGASVFALQIRGSNTIGDAGDILLENVAITGFYHSNQPSFNPSGIYIQGFADVSGITFSGVSVDLGMGLALGASGLTTVLDLGDSTLETDDPLRPLIALGTNAQNPVRTYLDASGATLGGVNLGHASDSQIEALRPRILDGSKVAALGAVYLKEKTIFVGPDSFVAPATEVDLNHALSAARAGDVIILDEGTYSGNLTVAKALTLQGQGESTVLQGTFMADNGIVGTVDAWAATAAAATIDNSSGRGISISASQATVRDMKIVGYQSGLEFTGPTMGDVTLANLVFENNYTGLRKGTAPSVTGVEMTGVTFRNGVTGIAVYTATGASGRFDEVYFDEVAFEDLSFKGIYAEALSNALLENLSFENVGQFGQPQSASTGKFGNGIDLNLKHGEFSNIVIDGFVMTDVGLSNGAGSPDAFGGAVTVKARDDAPSYNADPAKFTGTLVLRNGVITGTSTGLRVGEPGKAVSGPATRAENVQIGNFVANADHGMIDNVSTGLLTFVLPSGVGTLQVPATSTGPFRFVTGSGNVMLAGGPANDVAVVPGTLSANTISNPSAGVFEVTGPSGTKALTSVEFVQFDDQVKFLADIDFSSVTPADIENIVNTVAQNSDPEAEPAPIILELDTVENLGALITAIQAITPPVPSTPEAPPVVLQISIPESVGTPQEIEALTLNVPPGVKLVIHLGGNTVVAGSPALVVNTGVVEVAEGTISQTSTDHPAILVQHGGGVILNGVTVVESAVSENAAIVIEAGGQLLVNASATNIINTVGAGDFLDYRASENVDLSSVIFQQNGVTVTDPFVIEENVVHFIDNASAGFVTWATDQAFSVSSADLSMIGRAFDAVSANGTVNVLGTGGNDVLDLSAYGKKIVFVSQGGSDTFTGGGNTDAVMVDGNASNYTVTNHGGGSFIIVDNRPPGRTLTLQNIEFLAFEGGAYLNLAGTPPPVGQSVPDALAAFPSIVNPTQAATLTAELSASGHWATFVITQGATDIVLASVQDNGPADGDPAPGRIRYQLAASTLAPASVNQVRLFETDAQVANAAGLAGFNTAFTVSAPVEVVPVPLTYGSVDSDPTLLSPVDAAYILQFVVQLRSFTSAQRNSADVSFDGYVNSLDASYVLSKILNPAFCMPVEGCPPAKQAAVRGIFAWKTVVDEQGMWRELVLDQSAGVVAFDIEVEGVGGASGAQPVVPDGWISASHTIDGILRVSSAGTTAHGDGVVLRISVDPMNDWSQMRLSKIALNGVDISAAQVGTSLDVGVDLPVEYALGQNYPNPFNPATEIRFDLPEAAHVTLEVFNILGMRVAVLVDAQRQAGSHMVRFDAGRLASGTYLYKLTAGRFSTTRKMMLIK